MGGGATMRAVAKVAGTGVINHGLRGFPVVPTAEHPFTSTARKATRPVASVCSSSDTNVDASAPVQKPCREIDDWEFAGGEDGVISDFGEPMPRLVFGGAPTLQEAKEATSDLKAALDVPYLSPKSTCGSFVSHPRPDMLVLSNSKHLETNATVASDTTATVPKQAIQAFRLLHESSAAQTVVASIASDPNVWSAVMKNEALVEYLHSQKTSNFVSDMDESMKECAVGTEIRSNQSPNCFDDEFCNFDENMPKSDSKDFFQNIKLRVEEMMTILSGYFQNLFGVSEAVDGSNKTTFADTGVAMGASFMGLAVMVLMLVVLKRT